MTNKRELLVQTQQEIADLLRLVDILTEIEGLNSDPSVEKIVDSSPHISSLLAEATRITKKYKNILPTDLLALSEEFHRTHKLFTDIYHLEVEMKNDVNRLLRIELRRRARLEREANVIKAQDNLCVKCGKKPRRINDYCKRCAREEGVLVKGKII